MKEQKRHKRCPISVGLNPPTPDRQLRAKPIRLLTATIRKETGRTPFCVCHLRKERTLRPVVNNSSSPTGPPPSPTSPSAAQHSAVVQGLSHLFPFRFKPEPEPPGDDEPPESAVHS